MDYDGFFSKIFVCVYPTPPRLGENEMQDQFLSIVQLVLIPNFLSSKPDFLYQS